jgi:hypothetical protein
MGRGKTGVIAAEKITQGACACKVEKTGRVKPGGAESNLGELRKRGGSKVKTAAI